MEEDMKIINQEEDFFVHYKLVSAGQRVEFVGDHRMSYIVLRGRRCNIILLNENTPTKEKSDNSKASFYEELEQVFKHFPTHHTKILRGDFNAKIWERGYF